MSQELDALSHIMSRARAGDDPDEKGGHGAGRGWGRRGRLDTRVHDFGSDVAEFVAIGTAVKAESRAGGGTRKWRNNKDQPFTSDLSGQDFCVLIRAGYAPLGMVVGTCVYHITHRQLGNVVGMLGRNVELEQFTRALYDARELAMGRIQAAAQALAAEGIVGLQLRQHSHTWGSHTTEFLAVGTAIRPLRDNHKIEPPTMVLNLDH